MNKTDREDIKGLYGKFEELDKKNLKLYIKIEKILDILDDSDSSDTKGLVSRVNELDNNVANLLIMNRLLKRASVFIMTMMGGLLSFLAKHFIIDGNQ